MHKKLIVTSILAMAFINFPAHATDESERIRQECELQVQSYDINDSEEYRQLLDDCIESMSVMDKMEQYESEKPPADHT